MGATRRSPLDALPTILSLALGGALGALTRHGISQAAARTDRVPPWVAILVANVGGSVLIGALVSLMAGLHPQQALLLRAGAVMGYCGALTTYSTFSLQTVQLLEAGQWRQALTSVGLSLGAGILGAWAGLAVPW